jgi:hypothetical protein
MKAIFPLILLALVFGAGPAMAGGIPTVYHSSDGVDPGQPKQFTEEIETLQLYVCVRVAGGTDCSTASGDELRGIDVIVEVEGEGQFTGFDKNGDIVHYPEGTTFSPTSTFRLNAVQAVSPPSAGPQLLGTLTLEGNGIDGSVVRARGQVVTDDLSLKDIDQRIVALPEPNAMLLLVSGILGLTLLGRLRGLG